MCLKWSRKGLKENFEIEEKAAVYADFSSAWERERVIAFVEE